MAPTWEKSYPSGVQWDFPLPPAVPLESLLETAATRPCTPRSSIILR
jgi:hypothetical protein